MKRIIGVMLALLIGCLPLFDAAAEALPPSAIEAVDATPVEEDPDVGGAAIEPALEDEDGEVTFEPAEPEIAEVAEFMLGAAEDEQATPGDFDLPSEAGEPAPENAERLPEGEELTSEDANSVSEENEAEADGDEPPLLASASFELVGLEDAALYEAGGSVHFQPKLYPGDLPLTFTWQRLDLSALPADATPDEREAAWVTIVDSEEGHSQLTLENYDPSLRELYRVIVSDGTFSETSNEARVLIYCDGGPEYVVDGNGKLCRYNGPGGDIAIPTDQGIKSIGPGWSWGPSPFKDAGVTSVYVPDGISVGAWAFWSCDQLRSVRLPGGMTAIGEETFKNCTALETVNIPETVVNIRSGAFEGCTGLKRIDLPNAVQYVGDSAFKGCTGVEEIRFALRTGSNERPALSEMPGLKRITIYVWNEFGGSLTYAGNMFSRCPQLEKATLTGPMTTLHGLSLSQLKGPSFTLELPDGVTSVTQPELIPGIVRLKARPGSQTFDTLVNAGIEPIYFDSGDYELAMSGGLAVVTGYRGTGSQARVPDSVQGWPVVGIEEGAFAGHGELTAVALPEALIAIGAGAFAGCDGIRDMVIPRQAAIYGEDALAGHVSVYPNSLAALYCLRNGVAHTMLTVESLALSRESMILAPKKKGALEVSFEPTGIQPEITFTSSKPSVATVSKSGVVTAKKAGTAIITVTADGLEASCKVTVGKAPSKVTVKAPTTAPGVGDEFDVVVTFNKGAVSELTYRSSDPNVLDVDPATGHAEALAEGRADIVAAASNGKHGSLSLTVGAQATGLSLDRAEAALNKGQQLTLVPALTGGSAVVHYASSDEAVATVDAFGRVQAVGGGEARIIATTTGGLEAECALTVHEVALSAPAATLAVGDALALNVVQIPASGESVTVKSSNAKVLRIARNGDTWTAKGVKAGTAKVTATSASGAKATLSLTVKKKASGGSLILPEMLGIDDRWTLRAKSNTSGYATIAQVELDPDAEGQAEYAGGQLIGRRVGEARIRAQLYDGRWTAWQSLTIADPPASDDMCLVLGDDLAGGGADIVTNYGARRPFAPRVAKGDHMTVRVGYRTGTGGSYTAESTNEAVLRVDGDVIRFVGTGTASVIYTAYSGAQTQLDLRVLPAPRSVRIVGDSAITGGFTGFVGVLTDRGAWDPFSQTLDTGYDYLSLSVKGARAKTVSLARLNDSLKIANIGGRHSFTGAAKSASSKATITVQLFNGIKAKKTIKGRKNKLNLSSKPGKREIAALDGGVGAWLKSLEYTSAGKLVAEYYFVNGSNQKLRGTLDGLGASVTLVGDTLAWKPLDGVKVSVGKKSSATVKVTFSGDNIYLTGPGRPFDLWQYGAMAFEGWFSSYIS